MPTDAITLAGAPSLLQFFKWSHEVKLNTHGFWIIGFIIALVGATITAVGFLVQKSSHIADAEECLPAGAAKPAYWERKRWLLGGFLVLLGNAIFWVASGLAPQSLLSCLDCWNIIVVMVAAPICFGEPVSARTYKIGALLVVSCVWVVLTAPKAYHEETADRLFQAFKSETTVAITMCSTAFLLSMAALSKTRWERHPAPLSAMEFTAISAVFAWYASILSKGTAMLLVTSAITGSYEFLTWIFVFFVGAFLICAVSQIHFLNWGLKLGDAVVVLPIFMAMSMTGQILIGGLFFNELQGQTFHAHAKFWPGVFSVVLGLVLLSREGRDVDDDEPEAWPTSRTPIKSA